jgi:hypothetical protein
MKRLGRLTLVVLALGLLAGCAEGPQFRTPAEFRDKKVKEDPPGTYVPWLQGVVKPC